MFGHVERPGTGRGTCSRVREQQRATGGFTEFVPLPFVHMEAPIWLRARARGPTFGEALLMHAVGRLALHPWITNVQASWVKLGPARRAAALARRCQRPRRHADERVDLARGRLRARPGDAAGADGGADPPNGRVPRQRTTLYADAPAERVARSFGAPPLAEPLNPPVREAGLRRRRGSFVPAWSGRAENIGVAVFFVSG